MIKRQRKAILLVLPCLPGGADLHRPENGGDACVGDERHGRQPIRSTRPDNAEAPVSPANSAPSR